MRDQNLHVTNSNRLKWIDVIHDRDHPQHDTADDTSMAATRGALARTQAKRNLFIVRSPLRVGNKQVARPVVCCRHRRRRRDVLEARSPRRRSSSPCRRSRSRYGAPCSSMRSSIILFSPPRMRSRSSDCLNASFRLMLSISCSKMFAGLKLGGNERGGKSLNVDAN